MNGETLLARQALVCGSGLFYWTAVSVQAARVRRRIGRHPNLKPRGVRERLLWLAWFAVILVWVMQPVVMGRVIGGPLVAVIDPLYGPGSFAAGAVLVVGGQAGTFWCYRALGDAWRVGIRRRERTALVTIGPYARVRHPIYSFQMMILLGVVLLLPTPLSLVALALHGVASGVKARHEEAHLTALHEGAWRAYAARAGRFLPRRRAGKCNRE